MAHTYVNNNITTFMRGKVDEYVASDQKLSRNQVCNDIACLLGCTGDAVNHWTMDRNKVSHAFAQKLALLFGVDMDDLTAPKKYAHPETAKELDATIFMKSVMSKTTERPGGLYYKEIKCEDLRRDARDSAEQYLRAVGKLVDPLKPATAPIGDRMPGLSGAGPHSGPSSSCDARPTLPHATWTTPAPATSEANQIKLFLHQANKFAQTNKLEWVIRGDGSLGAKRVVTEEF